MSLIIEYNNLKTNVIEESTNVVFMKLGQKGAGHR